MARRRTTPPVRRKRTWADDQITDLGFAEDALRSENLLTTYIAAGGSTQGCTVQRTIVSAIWWTDTVSSADNAMTFGLIKGTSVAADVPDPVAEPYADWAFLHTSFQGEGHGIVANDTGMTVFIDTSSSRKVDEVGETWWLVFRGSAPTAAAETFSVRARVRTLLLLS